MLIVSHQSNDLSAFTGTQYMILNYKLVLFWYINTNTKSSFSKTFDF